MPALDFKNIDFASKAPEFARVLCQIGGEVQVSVPAGAVSVQPHGFHIYDLTPGGMIDETKKQGNTYWKVPENMICVDCVLMHAWCICTFQ